MKSAKSNTRPPRGARVRRGFTPISIPKYVKLHAASNPGTNAVELAQCLRRVVQAKLAGARCQCGEPIWAIGSVHVGFSCFTCITGEATPEDDYEVE